MLWGYLAAIITMLLPKDTYHPYWNLGLDQRGSLPTPLSLDAARGLG